MCKKKEARRTLSDFHYIEIPDTSLYRLFLVLCLYYQFENRYHKVVFLIFKKFNDRF